MPERAIKIIMALITIAIILTVLAVCIGIPIQQSTTQENTGYKSEYYKKGVDERDVSANFVTLQHVDDSYRNEIVSTPAINFGIHESDDIQVGDENSEDVIVMKSGGNRPVNLAMLKSEDVNTMSSDRKKPVSVAMLKFTESATTQTQTDAKVSNPMIPGYNILEGSKGFTENQKKEQVTLLRTTTSYDQSSSANGLVTPARRSDVQPDLIQAAETSAIKSTLSSPRLNVVTEATGLIQAVETSARTPTLSSPRLNVVTEATGKKEQSIPPTETKTEPNTSTVAEPDNLVDPKSRDSKEINMPENLAEDVKSNLASIANSLDSMVQLLKGMQQKTDKMFENMTATINGLFQNLPNLLAATPVPSPRDCTDIAAQGYNESSTYVINPEGAQSYRVYCDLHSEGGGWTVFQRRFDGSVNFYQSWQEYVDGFGKAFGEYWAGLELIHRLTLTGSWELLIQLEDFDGNLAFAHYASFRVGSAESNYRLYVGAYDGTAGDAMTEDNHNKEFSTFDLDNDERSWGNCAQYRKGAWWYGSCSAANLNGLYLGPKKVSDSGMYWRKWKNSYEVLRQSEMKMRRIL